MKKTVAILLCAVLVLALSACSAEKPNGITVEDSLEKLPESVIFIDDGKWPENEYTQDIPVLPGTVGWVMLDHTRETCGIQSSGMTKAQFDAYYKTLQNAGFAVTERVEEESGGQNCISIGTVLSNGSRSVSLAYADGVLMMTIVNCGISGTKAGLFRPGNLENVYVSAYSTYDSKDGVQVVTELYVPEGSKNAPQFSAVYGMVTVRVGDETTTHYLGNQTNGDTVGIGVNTMRLGSKGEKGVVVIAGTAYAGNAVAGCGSFAVSYEITIP